MRDISEWATVSQESGGLNTKDWVTRPQSIQDESQSMWWLFKPIKAASYRRCDDWSEKIASELARLIGLPAARVELAQRTADVGIISRNVIPDGFSLVSGDTLLSEFPGYVSCAGEDRPTNRVGHNLDNIEELLERVGPPPISSTQMSGFDVFVGYLVFDAWIANTDRHAINWGVLIRNDDGSPFLAPSFDHGSALASGAQDAHLARIDPAAYAERGTAQRFEGGGSLVDLATRAVGRAGPAAGTWLEQIGSLQRTAVEEVVHAVPGMSGVRRRFISTLLDTNRRRLTP